MRKNRKHLSECKKEERVMKIREQVYRLEQMHRMIRLRATGCPEDFAKRLGLSVSRLSRIIAYLKAEGAPIVYCRHRKTYYYEKPYEITASIKFGV